MIHFPRLTTRRLRAQMVELTIGQSITIAGFPKGAEEAANTLMLRSCAGADCSLDPAHWTLQERALGVGHYLMSINVDEPNFKIGDGRFSDYLDAEHDIDLATADVPLSVGHIEGDDWAVQHLYGYMLEAIERVQGQVSMPGGHGGQGVPMTARQHWVFGCMAAQMVRVRLGDGGEVLQVLGDVPEPHSVGQYDDWLIRQMTIFSHMPDNQFAALYMLYRCGKSALHHLFDWEFSHDDGRPVFLARTTKEKGAEAALPPATFHADACLSPTARELGRKHAASRP